MNLKKILLVAIYAPNGNQDKFYRKLYEDSTIRKYDHIYMMGDYNAIVDKTKDYQKERKRRTPKRKLPKEFFLDGRKTKLRRCMEREE